MRRWLLAIGLVSGLLLTWAACGSDPGPGPTPNTLTPPDAGTSQPVTLPVELPPNGDGWTFYGPEHGGPNQVFGASLDEGGNLWVAGGEEGLFVLRSGETRFERFTMDDGLRPFGYLADGSDPPGEKYLKVISVSGAWAGSAFVGYAGRPPPPGELDCENNWDGPNPDPSIYKSGDADRVTLTADGISVVHYDIFSGPGVVGAELRGREKICDVLRIRWDPANDKVWFGGNHAFAMGEARYDGTGRCRWADEPFPPAPDTKSDPLSNDYGHHGCNGVLEHVHPALNGYRDDSGTQCCSLLTGGYYGVSVDPLTNDVWFAGQMRTTRFRYASLGGDYFAAQTATEAPESIANRIDVWPDHVTEPDYPRPSDRVEDLASGGAAMPDGTVWVSSFSRGLAHVDAEGTVLRRLSSGDGLVSNKISAVVRDPLDDSLWAGAHHVGGLMRLTNGTVTSTFGHDVFGRDLTNQGISDLQTSGSGTSRRLVVSFAGNAQNAGAVGVYDGP